MDNLPIFDAYNFPDDENLQSTLFWMGEDYVSYIGNSLYKGFHDQDPGCEIIALKNEADPEIHSWFRAETGAIRTMEATFKVQVAIRASHGEGWRLFITITFMAEDLDTTDATIHYRVEVERSEGV